MFRKECGEQQRKGMAFPKSMKTNGRVVPGLARFGGHRSPEAVVISHGERGKYGRGLRFTLR